MNYQNNNNVVAFRRVPRSIATTGGRGRTADAFDTLTSALVMERHRRGELEPEVLAALLAGVGLSQ